MGTCEKLRSLYQHTLPGNAARLREKYNAYKNYGYEVLVSAKNGNQKHSKDRADGRALAVETET